jgi:c-di-GMP-binding flagellar brake protein YcgR
LSGRQGKDSEKKLKRIIMKERRREERFKILNEIIISVTSTQKDISQREFLYNHSEDISLSGAKIQSNILLPVDTLISIDFKLKSIEKQITTMGKVRWVKVNIENKTYEAGVEFVDTPSDAVNKLKSYITKMTKLHDQGKKDKKALTRSS